MWDLRRGSYFCIWISNLSKIFFFKHYPFSIELSLHFNEKWIGDICVVLFLDFLFCPSNLSMLRPIWYHLDYCSFMISLETGLDNSLSFILLFQNWFGYSSSSAFPYKFENKLVYNYKKKEILLRFFYWNCINL